MSMGCSETGIFFPSWHVSITGHRWAKWPAFTRRAACALTPAAVPSAIEPKGQDQTPAHVGGGSRGFFSDHALWLWAIRGTLQETVFLEGHFRPHITVEILAAKLSWKETPGIQWELLQGPFGARKSQASHYRQACCCDLDCRGTSEESASKEPSP